MWLRWLGSGGLLLMFLRRLAVAVAAGDVHDLDVLDRLAAPAPDLAGQPLRVERPGEGDRLALVLEGDHPDPLLVCTHARIKL